MEDKCPFCGAAEIPMPEGKFYYACGTYGISEEGRSWQCWKAELAALRADLREAMELIDNINDEDKTDEMQAFLTRLSMLRPQEK